MKYGVEKGYFDRPPYPGDTSLGGLRLTLDQAQLVVDTGGDEHNETKDKTTHRPAEIPYQTAKNIKQGSTLMTIY